jgi:aarF domain-containing kinase
MRAPRRRAQGQALLDAISLASASRNIASQHVHLRTAQWNRFRRSSGAAQEVEQQISQVLDGARAAFALAKRFLEEETDTWKNGDEAWKSYSTPPTSNVPGQGLEEQRIKSERTPDQTVATSLENELDLDQPPPGINLNVFHSKKVARSLGQKTLGGLHPLDPRNKPSRYAAENFPAADVVNEPMHQDPVSTYSAPEETVQQIDTVVSEELPDTPSNPFHMRESRVPSTRVGRLWQYAGLGTSMAFGAIGESFRRATGGPSDGSLMLSPKNMERLVAKLSRMRGAALKLGQMISFQDSRMLPPEISEVLLRVQDSADYMPPSQRDSVLASNLGSEWRDLFSRFDEIPIAAASIGQVHKAVFKPTGQEVAVKIQYPGVATSISSDLNNLSILLTASRLLPKGLFLNKTIANARTELAWECDYLREAECAIRFKNLLEDDTSVYTVPEVIQGASGKEVITAEFMHGTAVTKIPHLSQQQRDWIGTHILRLCLREITEFKFMQTDPNWTNFLFNSSTKKIELLDFGASRDFPSAFIDPYIKVLRAASEGDRKTVYELSIQLGYLTGSESKAMADAHIGSVLTLAEPFGSGAPDVYDFKDQTITDRVRTFIPLMLKERLAPPPEETYSLHRKLSGAFLLCAKLGSQIRCKELFANAMTKYSA